MGFSEVGFCASDSELLSLASILLSETHHLHGPTDFAKSGALKLRIRGDDNYYYYDDPFHTDDC